MKKIIMLFIVPLFFFTSCVEIVGGLILFGKQNEEVNVEKVDKKDDRKNRKSKNNKVNINKEDVEYTPQSQSVEYTPQSREDYNPTN